MCLSVCLQVLKRLLFLTKEDTEIDHEDEVREMAVTQLQLYATESIDELSSVEQVGEGVMGGGGLFLSTE